jgi:flagellar biosynthesis/type III secretory pathway M-ring protein FliF/YscJ
MQATGDPAAAAANTVAFSAFALVGLIVAVITYRPLFCPRTRASRALTAQP